MSRQFTKEEAKAKVGKRIRTTRAWVGVPTGSFGNVVKAAYMGKRKPAFEDFQAVWDVVIEWELREPPFSERKRKIQDWFPKWEYAQYLEEVSE